MPTSTVCAVLVRLGLSRRWRLGPPEPPNRYCRRHPGELIHVDIKKLGRFDRPGKRVLGDGKHHSRRAGWEFIHVAIDDTTRLAYVEILDDEHPPTCVGFLRRALAWFAAKGITVRTVDVAFVELEDPADVISHAIDDPTTGASPASGRCPIL